MATTINKIYEYIGEAFLTGQAVAYTPTTPYTGNLPSKTVRKGSKGSDVKHLQKFLNWCIKAGLKVDGVFGSKTKSAVKRWQKQYKLKKVDGIFGSASRKKAQSIIDAHKPEKKPVPTPSTNAQKIVEKAKEFSWPYGTVQSKSAYKTGSARKVYKTALKKHMKKKAKISQSDCGYFVSTCVRASGTSDTFLALPASAKKPYPSVPSTMKIVHKGTIGTFKLKAGDIIRYRKTNGHQHTVVYIGDGKIAHAGRGHWFPKVTSNKPWNNSNVKHGTIQVIRAK